VLVTAGASAAMLVLIAGPAAAHIIPDPSSIQPGTRATVAFNIEHGCGTSPTTKLTFKIPKRVKRVEAVAKTGWKERVSGGTVVFAGGPLGAHTEDTFSITFTAPKKKTVLVWKVIQSCVVGVNRWIDTSKNADEPPPRVGVGVKVKLPD
jgi:uncharacterized protein YcnI